MIFLFYWKERIEERDSAAEATGTGTGTLEAKEVFLFSKERMRCRRPGIAEKIHFTDCFFRYR
jgi:hypothetical protein